MKIRFNIRHLLVLLFFCAVSLSTYQYVQDKRSRGSDCLFHLLERLNCKGLSVTPHNSQLFFDSRLALRLPPTQSRRFWGDTVEIVPSLIFNSIEIRRDTAKVLCESRATKNITELCFRDVQVSKDAVYFLKGWQSLDRVSFEDVEFSEKWRSAITCQSSHVSHMLFAGSSINIPASDFAKLRHLKTLVLSNVGLSLAEIEHIRCNIPDTLVVVTSCIGSKESMIDPIVTANHRQLTRRFRQQFQALENAVASSIKLDRQFEYTQVIEESTLIDFERQFQNPLPESLIAFLRARTIKLPNDPIQIGLAESPPILTPMDSIDGTNYQFTNCALSYFAQPPHRIMAQDFLKVGSSNSNEIWLGLTTGELFEGNAKRLKLARCSSIEKLVGHYVEVANELSR